MNITALRVRSLILATDSCFRSPGSGTGQSGTSGEDALVAHPVRGLDPDGELAGGRHVEESLTEVDETRLAVVVASLPMTRFVGFFQWLTRSL